MKQNKPNLAFVGVGWIGRNRMQAVLNANVANVVAIADTSKQCTDEALSIADVPVYATLVELLENTAVDGVVIATPSALHTEQAVAALERGNAVFCQKPLGRNLTEVEAVIAAAEKNNRILGVDFSYRYTNAFQRILPIIQSGELGEIYAIDLKFHNAYGPDKSWFYDIKQAGGGCVLDLGIHLLDLMMCALDFPEVSQVHGQLFSKGKPVKGSSVVEDYADVSLLLDSGANAHLACSWNLQAGCEATIEVTFYGTRGGVAVKNISGSFYDFAAYRYYGTKTEVLVEPPDDWGGKAILNWITKLAAGGLYDPAAVEFLSSAKALDMIYGRR